MPPTPRVTVITPTYNRADLLAETIDSVLGQGYPDLEYLVIDDGSTDATRQVVAPYLQSHPGAIRYFHHDNRGEAATVNRGWELATGDYFAYVGSDDPMLGGWLEKGVEFMEQHTDVLVGYPDWRMIDQHSRPIKDVQVREYDVTHMAGWFDCLPGPGTFIRRAALGDMAALRDTAVKITLGHHEFPNAPRF
ncbi:MAG: glycosyltransferase family A protein [Rhodospirillales bacterium]|nr:glycosyltransferase family A protein [Rhodospirillales bacterium]